MPAVENVAVLSRILGAIERGALVFWIRSVDIARITQVARYGQTDSCRFTRIV
jgi:hypothetical protein